MVVVTIETGHGEWLLRLVCGDTCSAAFFVMTGTRPVSPIPFSVPPRVRIAAEIYHSLTSFRFRRNYKSLWKIRSRIKELFYSY